MSLSDALGLAIPVVLLLSLAIPGEPRWIRRPWLVTGPPRRATWAALYVVLLIAGIVRIVS